MELSTEVKPARPLREGLSWRVLAAVYVGALCVQDFGPTQAILGRFGATPATPIALAMAPYAVLRLSSWKQLSIVPRVCAVATVFGGFAFAIGIAYAAFLPETVRSEDLFLKVIKEAAVYGAWVASIAFGSLLLCRAPRAVAKAATVGLIANLMLLTYERLSPNASLFREGIFHASRNVQSRPRLLTPEASTAAALVVALALIVIIMRPSVVVRLAVAASTTVAIVLIESKGALATLVAALALGSIYTLWRSIQRSTPRQILLRLLTLLALLYLAFTGARIVSDQLTTTRDVDASQATRTVYAISARIAILQKPLGAGFGSNIAYAGDWLAEARREALSSFPPSALREIDQLIRASDDRAFSPKSLIVTLVYFGGVAGVVLFLYLMMRLHSAARASEFWGATAAMFLAVGLTTYLTSLYEFNLTLLLALTLGTPRTRPVIRRPSSRGMRFKP